MARTRIVPRRLAPPLVTLALLAIALAAPANGWAAAWLGPTLLPAANSRTGNPPPTQIGVDKAGDTFVLMLADKGPPQYVQVATRPAGAGSWIGPAEIGSETVATVGQPAMAVDPVGHALVAFVNSDATPPCNGAASGCLHVVSVSPNGSTKTETLMANFNGMLNVAVALDPSGSGAATVAWYVTPSAGAYQMQAMRGTIGGTWATAATPIGASTTSTISSPHVAIDGHGQPVVSWLQTVTGINDVFTSIGSGSGFSPPGSIAHGTTSPFSQLFEKTNHQGNVDFVFAGPSGAGQVLQSVTLAQGTSTFSAPQTIATIASGHTFVGPQMETAPDGEAVAIWTDNFTSTSVVRSVAGATRTGGVWSSTAVLDGNAGDPIGPALAMDDGGNATAVWHNASTNLERYSSHAHGGGFAGALDGPAGLGNPVAAADRAGNVYVAWPQDPADADVATFDGVSPTLSLVTDPGIQVFPGDPISMSASASDLWSNPVAVHWDFGDGQAADGPSVSHAYADAGTFNARAIATDASGNATTQNFTETVSAAPVAPTPAAPPVTPPPPPPDTLPPPVLGDTINVIVLKDPVFIKLPGEKTFHQLIKQAHLPNGTVIDTRKGRVLVVIDNGNGGQDSAQFYDGIFEVNQPKRLKGLANIFLNGGGFKGCPKAPVDPHAQLSRKTASSHRSVRHLWGQGSGKFRTVGRFSSASVRGTKWLTDDRCDGTLTRVVQGKVAVRDFLLQKTILLKRGQSYFARPKPARKG